MVDITRASDAPAQGRSAVAGPHRRWVLWSFAAFCATEGVLILLNAYDAEGLYRSWGLPEGAHSVIGATVVTASLATWLALVTRAATTVLVGWGVLTALGYALLNQPPSVLDALWYLTPVIVLLATRALGADRAADDLATVYLLASILLLAALLNAANYGNVQAAYVRWGYPPYWNQVTAGFEMLLALALTAPASRPYALLAQGALLTVITATLVRAGDALKLIELGYLAVPSLLLLRHHRPWRQFAGLRGAPRLPAR